MGYKVLLLWRALRWAVVRIPLENSEGVGGTALISHLNCEAELASDFVLKYTS